MATVDVKGLPEIFKKLKAFRGEVWGQVEEALTSTAESVAASARLRAPSYTGYLREKISPRWPKDRKGVRTSRYTHYVVSSAPEGHLVEFGTGQKYQLPTGIKLGRPSRASGKHAGFFGKKAQERLIEWARARGAQDPEGAARKIAAVLEKGGGVRPHPYLFPALLERQGELLRRLEAALVGAIQSTAGAA